jgi:hypothetical protein
MSTQFRAVVPALLLAAMAAGTPPRSFGADAPKATPAPAPASGAASAAATPSAPADSSALGYRSAFEGYRTFTEQPVAPWRESNNVVGRIGGWMSYAREGQGGPVAGSADAPAAAASAQKNP